MTDQLLAASEGSASDELDRREENRRFDEGEDGLTDLLLAASEGSASDELDRREENRRFDEGGM